MWSGRNLTFINSNDWFYSRVIIVKSATCSVRALVIQRINRRYFVRSFVVVVVSWMDGIPFPHTNLYHITSYHEHKSQYTRIPGIFSEFRQSVWMIRRFFLVKKKKILYGGIQFSSHMNTIAMFFILSSFI